MKAQEIMVKDPVSIRPNHKLKDVLKLMKQHGVSHLIVTDENKTLKGVIAKSDILKHILEVLERTTGRTYTSLELNNISVDMVMTKKVIHINSETRYNEIKNIIVDNKINCIPVTDENLSVQGIITSYDLLKQ